MRVEIGSEPALRIGELSRRVGVRPETLRAWERRYELTSPRRTQSGYRLYSLADETRVRAMTRYIAQGISAAEAARLARAAPKGAERGGSGATEAGRAAPTSGVAPAVPLAPGRVDAEASVSASTQMPALDRLADEVAGALLAFDGPAANAAIDTAFGRLAVDEAIGAVLLPALARIGDLWADGEASVAQEHFATALIRGRLLALGRGWGSGGGPLAVLACPPGERHDVGLVAFGLALADRGWRIAFLGADTPVAALNGAADELRPELVIVAAVEPGPFERAAAGLAALAKRHGLMIAGAGALPEIAATLGAGVLEGDPVDAADALARTPAAA